MASKKDLKLQNPKYTVDLIEIFSQKDPTSTNKYLPYMIKLTDEWVDFFIEKLQTETFSEMFECIKDFEELSQKNLIENKDIYSYKTTKEVLDVVNEAKDKVTKSQIKKLETVTIFEDDRFLVIQPLTSRSSNVYGKSTKWCVSADNHDFKKYFKQYTEKGVLVFLIDKSVKEEQSRDLIYSKVAFHNDIKGSGGMTIWDTKDSQVSAVGMMDLMEIVPSEVMKTINTTLKGKTNAEIAKERGISL